MSGEAKLTLLKLLGLGSAAGAAALVAFAVRGPGTPLAPAELAAREPAAAVVPEASLRYAPVAGQRYIYGYERRVRFSGLGRDVPEVAFRGEFYVDVLRADSTGFEALVSETVQEAGGKQSAPLRARVSPLADKLELFAPPLEGEEAIQFSNITRDLAAHWLFPLRTDTVGTYTARVETLADENGQPRRRKTKLAYLTAGRNLPELLRSTHVLRWDPSIALPAEVQGSETTRLGQGSSALSAESGYRLAFRAKTALPGEALALRDRTRDPSSLALANAPGRGEHPEYAKLNWGDLLARLQGINALPSKARLDLFGDLLRYLRAHPERVAELARLLRDPRLLAQGADSALFKTIVGTLANLGTPEALAALREAYANPQASVLARGTILTALTTTPATLDALTRDFLARAMRTETERSLAEGAAFALGSALQSAPDDAQAKSAVALVLERWQAAIGSARLADQLALLDVMGNSGRNEFLPAVESVIQGQSDSFTRAKAVFALRFMSDAAAAQDLVRALGESDAKVREAAAQAMRLAKWNESFRRPLEGCAQGDPLARLQATCQQVLQENGRVVARASP